MAKQEAEWSNSLSIFWLKKHGYIPAGGGWRSGGIKWTYGLSGNESSIRFTITTDEQDTWNNGNHIQIQYTHTNKWTEEKSDMDFKISLTTTPCNYGGVRYWFVCPLYKNGQYCGKRVGVIYSIGKWFGCRHCGEIAYSAQMRGGRFRGSSVSIPDIERAEKEVKRYYYNGKPTRKYKRVMRLNKKLESGFLTMMTKLDKRFNPFADFKK